LVSILDSGTRSSDLRRNGHKDLLTIRDLVALREKRVVLRVDQLDLRRGEVLAVIGPNGAGKSTLLLSLVLLQSLERGEIRFDGERVYPGGDPVKLRRRTATVFQEPLLLDTSVRANVAAGLHLRGVSSPEAEKRVSHWMDRFGISHLASRHARQLSGGEAQRVSLARAFALEPDLLLLDEPFSALDAPTRAALMEDFEEVLRESGVTTLFVTHDRTEAMRLGDRIAVVMEGRLAQIGRPEEVFSSPADDKIAAFVGMENLIPGHVVEQRDGLALVEADGTSLQVVSEVSVDQQVLVCLRPEDIVLQPQGSESPPSSARNRLSGRITRLIPLGAQVRVTLDCGFHLTALVTRRSAEELTLKAGQDVLVSFKASSAHLVGL
jgi:molybdopterin-binding protein